MIYLFMGNSQFLINEAITIWKSEFIKKYSDFNMIHIKDINSHDKNFLSENLLSISFLGEKKLIIIDLDSEIKDDLQEFILSILARIPDDNIVLFNYPNPDKRLKFYKELEKNAEKKEYNLAGELDVFNSVQKRFKGKINPNAINLIIKYKGNKLAKVVNEIEKLLITNQNITEEIIKENIIPEMEESIFQIIDDILYLRINDAIEKIYILINEVNIYAFYNNLLANLRTSIFIMKLKKEKKSEREINDILSLGNKSFLINKNYNINLTQLKNLYIELVDIDKKMKSGFLLGSDDEDLLFEVEKSLLKVVK